MIDPAAGPHNIELEQALLGAILLNNDAFAHVGGFLRAEHFYEPIHRQLYEVTASLVRKGTVVTPFTLKTFLAPPAPEIVPGLTASQYLARLAAEATTVINAEDYGRVIYDLAVRRSLIEIAEDIASAARRPVPEQSVHALMAQAATALHGLETSSSIAALDVYDAGDDPEPEAIPPRGWLMALMFCRQFLSGIMAEGGAGKTSLRILQFLSMAIGRALTGHHVFMRCRVLIVSLEDSKQELQRRIAAARVHHKVSKYEVKGWLYYVTIEDLKGMKLATMGPNGPQRGQLAGALMALIDKLKIDVVAIDPTIKAHELNENLNKDMDYICDILTSDMAIQRDIAVDLSMHQRKGSKDPGDADSGRGASSVRDAGRLISTLTKMSPEEAQAYGIKPEDRKQYVRLDSAKANITRTTPIAWYELVGVKLENKTETYPNGDEVQTVRVWEPPKTWAGLSNTVLNAALDDIDKGLLDKDGQPTGQRYSPHGAAKHRAAWNVVRKHCRDKTEDQCREIVRTWCKTGVLEERKYHDPVKREEQSGLYVNAAKRPGAEVPE